jgi:hypothetical protein
MDPTSAAAIAGTIVTALAPYALDFGAKLVKRYASGAVANVTEEGCAAISKKAVGGGDGLLSRMAESVGRAFGWVAGTYVSQSDDVQAAIDKGASLLSDKAAVALANAAGTLVEGAVKSHLVTPEATQDQSKIDGKIKAQMLENLKAKGDNKALRGELLKLKIERERMELEARRVEILKCTTAAAA